MSELSPSGARARPRESARELAGVALATRVLGSVPRRLELTVGGFGPVTLSWEGHGAAGALRAAPVAFALFRGNEAGRLTIDTALAGRIVAAALGADQAIGPALGRLGPGGRGVVGGFVAGVLHAAGAPLAVSLAPAAPDAAPAPDAAVISLGVAAAGGTGWVALEVPRAWLDDALRLPDEARALEALDIEAAVELGRTTLAAGELAAVAPGDAIVFDGEAALADGASWAARLVLGDYAAEAVLAPDGALTIAGGFMQAGARPVGDAGAARAGRGDTTVLTALPVEIVVELARVRLRGDDVVGLGRAAVIPLGPVRGQPAVLRVAGQPWAEGELADVDGDLAVRVTRLGRS